MDSKTSTCSAQEQEIIVSSTKAALVVVAIPFPMKSNIAIAIVIIEAICSTLTTFNIAVIEAIIAAAITSS